MTKPDWKKKPHERDHMTAAEKVKHLENKVLELAEERDAAKEMARHYKAMRDGLRLGAARYEVLRGKELMVFDGEPVYLKDTALDEYCDKRKQDMFGLTMLEMLSQMRGSTFTFKPTNITKGTQNGNDAGSESKEADQKDSGHHTDVLRYADWYWVR
jgi:hypothetical protein